MLQWGVSAEKLLKEKNFKVLKKGLQSPFSLLIDGKKHLVISHFDFLVEKEKKKFVVYVHEGTLLADPTDPVLRRKLLEIKNAFKDEGLLLLDLSDRSIQEINFDFSRPFWGGADRFFQTIILLFIIGVVSGIIWLMVYLKLF